MLIDTTKRFELPMVDGPGAATPPAAPAPKPKRKHRPAPRAKPAPPASDAGTTASTPAPRSAFKFRLTIALGVAVPLLSLAASKVAGTLALHGHYALAGFGAAVGLAVLAVSLGHLAWAIGDVTGSGPRASWALAVALDAGLILCELVHVTATDAGLGGVCWAMLVAVAGFSMVLNVHAFLNHKAD